MYHSKKGGSRRSPGLRRGSVPEEILPIAVHIDVPVVKLHTDDKSD